jgi:hypothetical protein
MDLVKRVASGDEQAFAVHAPEGDVGCADLSLGLPAIDRQVERPQELS